MDIESLLKLVDTTRNSAMLRLTLARLLAAQGETGQAEFHLQAATAMDGGYTAAWKELGRVRQQKGDPDGATQAWQRGIEVARDKGDKQAEREMTVFLKRLSRT